MGGEGAVTRATRSCTCADSDSARLSAPLGWALTAKLADLVLLATGTEMPQRLLPLLSPETLLTARVFLSPWFRASSFYGHCRQKHPKHNHNRVFWNPLSLCCPVGQPLATCGWWAPEKSKLRYVVSVTPDLKDWEQDSEWKIAH